MGVLDWAFGKLGYVRPRTRATYGYQAAQISRLTASLQAETQFINTTLRFQLRILRARARQARQNNPFARRFVNMVINNVCGPTPFRLEGKVKADNGQPNKRANDKIEECWESWSRPGNCELTGKWSWNMVQRLMVGTLATDGELLLRKLKGPQYGPHGYQLQIIDVDRLWEYKNESLDSGGAIHASVEVDPDAKPVAYWLLKRRPSQWQFSGYTLEMERIPAEEMIHLFIPEFAEQVRGVPWMYAALLNLVNMGAFEEAAVIAARIGAANMGFIESPDGGKTLADMAAPGPKGDGTEDYGGDKGNPQIDTDPGAMNFLPPGYKFNAGWNPKYPDAAVEPFIKAMLRGVAAGLDVAYHNLANDLENVNYSSARIGELDERDAWMTIQSFVAEHLHHPLYGEWLPQQVLMNKLSFPAVNLERYQSVYFQARRWAWVDPLKEVGASIEAINAKLKSRTRIVAEGGEDFEDMLEEIRDEQKLAETMGVSLEPVAPKATGVVNEPGVEQGADGSGGTGGKKERWHMHDDELAASLLALAKATAARPAPAPEVKVEMAPTIVLSEAMKLDVQHHIEGIDDLAKEIGSVGPRVGDEVKSVLGEIRAALERPFKLERVDQLLGRIEELVHEVRGAGLESAETLRVVLDVTRMSVAEVQRLAEIASRRRIFITDKDGNPIGSEPVLA